MKQVWITKVGAPEVLKVIEAPDPEPKAKEVRIRVKASGINFADIMARTGIYPDAPKLPAVIGYEVSGVVDAVGIEAKRWKPGDKVIGMCAFGGYSDTVVLREEQVFALPEGLSFEGGAAIPVNYLTAYQMLVAMGSIKSGERVLIHSAAGGVGFASIDLCKIFGATPIGIASKHKHEMLKKRGVDLLIDAKDPSFDKRVMELTNGKGVHIVLDPVGGESWKKGYSCLAPTGRLVMFGFSAAAKTKGKNVFGMLQNALKVPWFSLNPVRLIQDNKALIGVNLGHMWGEREKVRAWAEEVLVWYREGKIQPVVDKCFSFEDAPKAHHYIQDRKNIGKVLLVP